MVSYSLNGHWGSFKALSVYRKGNFVTGCLTRPLWRLEPYAVKVARTVLRREASGNRCRLSDRGVLAIIAVNCNFVIFSLYSGVKVLLDKSNLAFM